MSLTPAELAEWIRDGLEDPDSGGNLLAVYGDVQNDGFVLTFIDGQQFRVTVTSLEEGN